MAIPTSITLFPDNEQKLQILGVQDDVGNFINNAVVLATLNDSTGTPVPPLNNASLASIDSLGDYSYTIQANSFTPAVKAGYKITLTVSVGGLLKETITIPVAIVTRDE